MTSLVFEGDKVVGVQIGEGATVVQHRASREVILALGSIQTPKLLQLSGIGPSEVLRAAGIDVRVDQPNVGGRMREHHCFALQYRLRENLGYNRKLSSPLAQAMSGIQYLATKRGALAAPSYDIVGFLKTQPELDRVDAQILMAPWTTVPVVPGQAIGLERKPGIQCIGYVLRPDSEGTVRITGAAPDAPLEIDSNFFATDHDRETGLRIFQKMRELFTHDPVAARIETETVPGPDVQSDDDVMEANLADGYCGYHAIGTCAMGPNDSDVVDPDLRVRGVETPAGHGLLGAPGDGRRQPQRPDDGDGRTRRGPDPRRSVSDDLAERLERVESRLAIGQLPIRYAMAVDARDVDTWVSLFVPDVQVGRDSFGHDALRAQIDPLLRTFGRSDAPDLRAPHRTRRRRHRPRHGATYCRAEHEVDERWIVMAICYFDDYQRVDGEWLFRRRRERHWYAADVNEHPQSVAFDSWHGDRARAARRVPDLGRILARRELSYTSASNGASCVQSVRTCCAHRSSDIAPIDTQKKRVSTGAPAVRVRTICATSSGVP